MVMEVGAAHRGITLPISSPPTSFPLPQQEVDRPLLSLTPTTTPMLSPIWESTVRNLASQFAPPRMAASGRSIRVGVLHTLEPMAGGLRRSRSTWIWSVPSAPTATFCWSRHPPTASLTYRQQLMKLLH